MSVPRGCLVSTTKQSSGALMQGLKLNDAFSAKRAQVIIRQGRKGHEADFIRKGELRVSHRSDCSDPSRLTEISKPEEVWKASWRL